MNRYESLAASYDSLMTDVGYRKRADWLHRQLKKCRAQTVLDLACGTGTISCLLAEKGYQVIATDASEEMLTQAMHKAMDLETPPQFLLQSMPRLRLAEPVDAAVSTVDSLNYLTRTADLQETFRRVFRWLKPGGVFLFDVNTPYKLRRMDGQLYMDETEETYCVWRTFFSEKQQVCTYQVDLFHLLEDETWERAYEEHRERAWTQAELTEFLQAAGFADIQVFGDLTTKLPQEDADRWIVRAVRPKKSQTTKK